MFIVVPDERRLEQTIVSNNIKNSMIITRKQEKHSMEDLENISSFATLNSSMLFMPKSTINTSYIYPVILSWTLISPAASPVLYKQGSEQSAFFPG